MSRLSVLRRLGHAVGSIVDSLWSRRRQAAGWRGLENLEARQLLSVQGEYYGVTNSYGTYFFDAFQARRTDSNVDFNWNGASPISGVAGEGFTARWTGKVHAATGGNYYFQTSTDDGVRLWIDGQKIIDYWYRGANDRTSNVLNLAANSDHDIRMEYFQWGGGSKAKLLWKKPGDAVFLAIPSASLSLPTQNTYGTSAATITTSGTNIESEEYDTGGNGVSYYDTTAYNGGTSSFRSDQDVDIDDLTGGGKAVSSAVGTEWLEYTINVPVSGDYSIQPRVASNGSGGTFHVSFADVDATGSWSVPTTGSWTTYQTLTARNITLTAGQQVMRLCMDANGATGAVANFDWLKLTYLGPDDPTNLSASAASATQVNLTWTDNSPNEDDFHIERKTGANGTWSEIGTASANATSYSDTTAAGSTTYYYRVRAHNTHAYSGYAASASVTTPAAIPGAPTGLAATVASPSQIDLTWTDNSSNETGFAIERAQDAEFSDDFHVFTVSTNVTSFSDSDVEPGKTYYYRVQALGDNGDSSYSAAATASTPLSLVDSPTIASAKQYGVEARFGGSGWKLGLNTDTNQSPQAEDSVWSWVSGQTEPFTFTATSDHVATFTIGSGTNQRSIQYDYDPAMPVTDLLLSAKAVNGSSSAELSNLSLDGESVEGALSVSSGATTYAEALIAGADLSAGWTLTGNMTLTWSGAPSSSGLEFMLQAVNHLQVGITATDDQSAESGPDAATFTVTRTGSGAALSQPLTVSWSVADGTASSGDLQATSGTVTIPANSNSATFSATPVDDSDPELDETFTVGIANSSGYAIDPAHCQAGATIVDNDEGLRSLTLTDNNPDAAFGSPPEQPTFVVGDSSSGMFSVLTEQDVASVHVEALMSPNTPSAYDNLRYVIISNGTVVDDQPLPQAGTDVYLAAGEYTIAAGIDTNLDGVLASQEQTRVFQLAAAGFKAEGAVIDTTGGNNTTWSGVVDENQNGHQFKIIQVVPPAGIPGLNNNDIKIKQQQVFLKRTQIQWLYLGPALPPGAPARVYKVVIQAQTDPNVTLDVFVTVK